jgi:hypothetical protein
MSCWLLVERIENRAIDEREGFQRFGLPIRQERLANEIKKGDLLIFYISSGVSMISDVRRATSDGVHRLRHGGDYDTAYPLAVSTEPVIVLPRMNWLPFKSVVDRLPLTSGKDWKHLMRRSLRRLSDEDAHILMNEVEKCLRASNVEADFL